MPTVAEINIRRCDGRTAGNGGGMIRRVLALYRKRALIRGEQNVAA
jgi:hypothetical protein